MYILHENIQGDYDQRNINIQEHEERRDQKKVIKDTLQKKADNSNYCNYQSTMSSFQRIVTQSIRLLLREELKMNNNPSPQSLTGTLHNIVDELNLEEMPILKSSLKGDFDQRIMKMKMQKNFIQDTLNQIVGQLKKTIGAQGFKRKDGERKGKFKGKRACSQRRSNQNSKADRDQAYNHKKNQGQDIFFIDGVQYFDEQ